MSEDGIVLVVAFAVWAAVTGALTTLTALGLASRVARESRWIAVVLSGLAAPVVITLWGLAQPWIRPRGPGVDDLPAMAMVGGVFLALLTMPVSFALGGFLVFRRRRARTAA